jgi:hypothetical protein
MDEIAPPLVVETGRFLIASIWNIDFVVSCIVVPLSLSPEYWLHTVVWLWNRPPRAGATIPKKCSRAATGDLDKVCCAGINATELLWATRNKHTSNMLLRSGDALVGDSDRRQYPVILVNFFCFFYHQVSEYPDRALCEKHHCRNEVSTGISVPQTGLTVLLFDQPPTTTW